MIDWWPGACDPQPDWRNPEIKGIAASEAELTGGSRAPLQMSLDLLYLILIWFNSEGTADQEKFTNTENSDAYIYIYIYIDRF